MMKLSAMEQAVFWILLLVGLIFFVKRIYFLYKSVMKGEEDDNTDIPEKRLITAARDVLLQLCNFKTVSAGDLAGIGHAVIFWGFLCFSINYIIFMFIGDGLGFPLRESAAAHCFLYLVDVAGAFVLLAVIWALYRRYIAKETRLERNMEAGAILIIIFILISFHFIIEGISINTEAEPFKTPLAGICAAIFTSSGLSVIQQNNFLHAIWWAHYLVLIGFMVYIPYSKHLHIIASPFNIFFRLSRSSGELRYPDIDKTEGFGAFKVEGFTRKQLLNTYSCTECGRCDINCPAFLSGKSLSPRKILAGVKYDLLKSEPGRIPSGFAITPAHDPEAVLSCTTCGACIEVCPVLNRPMDLIIEIRRGLVYEGIFDENQQDILRRTFDYDNPYALTPNSKDSLLEIMGLEKAVAGEKYDILYWLGCSAYFDERTRDIVRAVSKILKKLNLRFAALGEKEKCCGDFVRRAGDEGLFQQLAKDNIKAINKINFDILLTHCPHGYNTFKNEYSQFDAHLKVMHYSEFIANKLSQGALAVNKTDTQIIYHDPCYLGRHNGIYDFPRNLLNHVTASVAEFEKCKNKSFCCGAGGAHMWKHEEPGTRMNDNRMEQACATGVNTVATACPFCLAMLEESLLVKGLVPEIRIKDIAELVDEAIC